MLLAAGPGDATSVDVEAKHVAFLAQVLRVVNSVRVSPL